MKNVFVRRLIKTRFNQLTTPHEDCNMNPTNRVTKAALETWLKPVFSKKFLKKCTLEIVGTSSKGDGYLGDVNFVEVNGRTSTNEEKFYNFAIKSSKNSLPLRKMMPIEVMSQNEIYFYNRVLPTFVEFQEEKGIEEPFNQAPKYYDSVILQNMEVLILENMKRNGYCLHDRTKPMNREHIRKVMQTYGKYHAVSFALRDQKPDVFKALGEGLRDVMKTTDAEAVLKEFRFFVDLHKIAKEKIQPELAEKLTEVPLTADSTDPDDPFAVIVHGDCETNNFLFKYEDDQKTTVADVCFLDFQFSRLTSPICDLSYFLFSCISEEDIEHFDEINNLYYKSLSDYLKKLGSDPNKVFPFDAFSNQWRQFGKLGLRMMFPAIKNSLLEQEEIFDLAEMVESGREIKYSERTVERCSKRIFPIIQLAIEKKIL